MRSSIIPRPTGIQTDNEVADDADVLKISKTSKPLITRTKKRKKLSNTISNKLTQSQKMIFEVIFRGNQNMTQPREDRNTQSRVQPPVGGNLQARGRRAKDSPDTEKHVNGQQDIYCLLIKTCDNGNRASNPIKEDQN